MHKSKKTIIKIKGVNSIIWADACVSGRFSLSPKSKAKKATSVSIIKSQNILYTILPLRYYLGAGAGKMESLVEAADKMGKWKYVCHRQIFIKFSPIEEKENIY
ncbi:hypothetical protein [Salinibacillus kushneri]|uniref:hypothetical protein n=1 Tax=Salinibacillus kushneri TaxID=237682 RepID=UPI00115F7E50|nr:hypothetical protein [Salinibacillus kushneri]